MTAKDKIISLLNKAGVTIDGPNPFDVQIKDDRVYDRILGGGTLAIGESFMDDWWDVEDLASLSHRIYQAKIYEDLVSFDAYWLVFKSWLTNLQHRERAFQVGIEHYDIGDDLYQAMLDKRMVYTSACYRNGVKTLEEAQEQKLDMICRQLDLKPGQRVLDIGCGWGSFMKFASERYGVSCVGLSVSEGQTRLGRGMCSEMPIEFVVTDYRDYQPSQQFDHIVSIEMIEAVGPKNLRTYFSKAHQWLKDGGRFVVQAIGSLDEKPVPSVWMDKYIFPNGVLPSLPQMEKASRGLFIIDYMDNIGPDYDITLMEWWRRFDLAYPTLNTNNPKYDKRFYKMWKFYLHSCAGLFRSKEATDWQITFSKRP